EQVAEDDHGAVLWRQRADRVERPVAELRPLRGGRAREGVAACLRPERAQARPVDRAVDDDPVQPRPERAAVVEAVEVANGGEERLLRDVLGGGGVVDDEVRRAVGAGPVVPEQRLEARGVASLGSANPGALPPGAGHPAPTIRARFARRSIARDTSGRADEVRGPAVRPRPYSRQSTRGGTMRRFALALALALLVLPAGTAAGDGPSYVLFGWTGVTAPGLPYRYVTLPGSSETVLAAIRRSSGRVWSWRSLHGRWGVPMVATDGTAGGLSRD